MDNQETPEVHKPEQTAGPNTNHSTNNSIPLIEGRNEPFDGLAFEIRIDPGSQLGKRHKVLANIGEGAFGFVAKCLNTETDETVAIKVCKNDPESLHQAKQEIAILKKLQCLDPDTCNIVKWNGSFRVKGHNCLSFELLGQNLRDYLHVRQFKGLTMIELRPIIQQLATALHHLRSLEIVHADIKMENIMIVNPQQQQLQVKLIDFGLACPVSAIDPYMCVGTLGYMAPEVALSVPYNEAIDMWSLGQVVVQLATGQSLYYVCTIYDMLHYITEMQGQPPDHVLDRGLGTKIFFNRQNNNGHYWTLKTPEQFRDETGENVVGNIAPKLKCLDDLEQLMENDGEDQSDRRLLIDLIKRMLHLDPDQRITPLGVLQHPFLNQRPPLSTNPDSVIEKMGNQERPEVHELEQTAGPNTSPSIIEPMCVNETQNTGTESKEYTEEVDIQVDPNVENVGCLRQFRWFRKKPRGTLGKCHKVLANIGKGAFGFVAKCLNTETDETVAIKVRKNDPKTLELAKQEIAILKKLQCLDPDTCNIVKWNGSFYDKGRICLSFELLGQNLRDYLHVRQFKGLTMIELRPIIQQLATALHHLRSLEIVHADIKMENIMIVNPQQQQLQVKLIDFGLACPVSAIDPYMCVGTLGYMAPEVALSVPYNEAIDMWSLGQVVLQLAAGLPIYKVRTVYDLLHYITEMQGQPPDHVLDRGLGTGTFFNRQSNNDQQGWAFKTPEQFRHATGEKVKANKAPKLGCLDDLEQLMENDGEDQSDRRLLIDLIKRMLHLDPDQRITPLGVLQHPFLNQRPPLSTNPDSVIEKMGNQERPEVHELEQTAGPNTSPSIIEPMCVNETQNTGTESRENTEEGGIKVDSNVKKVSRFRRFIRWCQKKIRKLAAGSQGKMR